MLLRSRNGRPLARRFRAAVAVGALLAFTLVAPTLVLCESVTGHAAVEPAESPCCQRGFLDEPNAPGAPAPGPAGATVRDCGGDACEDTPIIASIVLPKPPRGGHHDDVVAVVPGAATAEAHRALATVRLAASTSPLPSFLSRHTVLRI